MFHWLLINLLASKQRIRKFMTRYSCKQYLPTRDACFSFEYWHKLSDYCINDQDLWKHLEIEKLNELNDFHHFLDLKFFSLISIITCFDWLSTSFFVLYKNLYFASMNLITLFLISNSIFKHSNDPIKSKLPFLNHNIKHLYY
jgi:hypothetical protein